MNECNHKPIITDEQREIAATSTGYIIDMCECSICGKSCWVKIKGALNNDANDSNESEPQEKRKEWFWKEWFVRKNV